MAARASAFYVRRKRTLEPPLSPTDGDQFLRLYIRKKRREQANRREKGAEPVDRFDADAVGHLAEHRRAQPAHAEGEPEEHAGDEAHASWHQLLRKDNDRREGGRQDEPDHHREHRRPEQIRVRQEQSERKDSENRSPDVLLAAEPTAKRSAQNRPRRFRRQKHD